MRSGSAAETAAWGRRLGQALRPGDFVALVGELGAGKTCLSRGVAEGAGVPLEDVSSPTFAIIQAYAGRLRLYHADLYRLTDADALYATGYFDLLAGADGAFLVEWAEQVPGAIPADALVIRLRADAEEDAVRWAVLEPRGARGAELARALAG
ncbi:MAG: tRNA (adenosine(37)-N6)-threonylcarbamoyltransferase complex ATPase subunit type 1 TsaE [Deltaproteobacteria bacterium]|nr:tRNA (adenosine(37)-N6)-threonylcarbamoyltransferase complex ATPase subunit type 1 TsaE [Deltaproteobacteria bacterium]